MSKTNFIIKSSIIIMLFSLFGKLLGFIREMLIAYKFGSGQETDAYFIAIAATGLITALVANSIRTTLIPILAEVKTQEGFNGKLKHTNNFLNLTVIISFFLVVIGIILAPLIVRVLAIGFTGEQFELAVLLMRIGMPALIIKAIVGIYRGYLQSENKFFESAISDVSLNIVTIIFLITLSMRYGIKGLMFVNILAVLSQFLIQIPSLKKAGYYYKLYLNVKDEYFKKLINLIPPVLIGVSINDLNQIINKTLASRLVTGSVSSLNYAAKLQGLVTSVFVTSIITVLFPLISKKASEQKFDDLNRINSIGFNTILIITIPATLLLILLAYPIVEIAFQRGQFDVVATKMTSIALIYYSIGIMPMSLRQFYSNIYYSLQDTKTPMFNGGIAVIFNLILSLILVRYMQHGGLALATSLASLITTILLAYGLKRKIGYIIERENIIVFGKTLISSIAISAIAFYLYNGLLTIFPYETIFKLMSLAISLGTSGFIYLILLRLFKVKEIETLLILFKTRMSPTFGSHNRKI